MNRAKLLSTVYRREQWVDHKTCREMLGADILNSQFGDARKFRLLGSGPKGYHMEIIDIPGATLTGPKWEAALRRSFEQTREFGGTTADLVIVDDPILDAAIAAYRVNMDNSYFNIAMRVMAGNP